jgi:plastocyanin
MARDLHAFVALLPGVGIVRYYEKRLYMFRFRTLALVIAVMLLVLFPSGLLAQGDDTTGDPCREVGGAAASPSASATANPTATAAATREASSQASPGTEACTIDIRDLAYHPAQTEIAVGTTVTWTNSDTVPHTATATDGTFDSGILDPGKSYSFTFEEAGTFDYSCLVHPQMKGTIVVR